MTFDPEADASFLYLVDEIGTGEAKQSRLIPIELQGSAVIVSCDDTGKALGVEFLGASNLFTQQMLEALAKTTE